MKWNLLQSILEQPSAPYREVHVRSFLRYVLESEGVPHFQDPVGNLVVGAADLAGYRRKVEKATQEPLRIFVAHMDHPGFHGVNWVKRDRRLKVKWFGGSPSKHLVGSRVWLADEEGFRGRGTFRKIKLNARKNAIVEGEVVLEGKGIVPPSAKSIFGGFDFRAFAWRDGQRIYTKAADDLVGTFVILSLALSTLKKAEAENFLGILTRAEEVGFIGAIGHLEQGWLRGGRRPKLAVSLETSRALPGITIGGGPVVRLGDRASIFDPARTEMLTWLAKKTLKGRYQRRIMDGGTCEGTVTAAYGIPTIALSIPLGNYHNQSFEGGPDASGPLGPAPEFVDRRDIEGMYLLSRAALKSNLPWEAPSAARRKEYVGWLKGARSLLRLDV